MLADERGNIPATFTNWRVAYFDFDRRHLAHRAHGLDRVSRVVGALPLVFLLVGFFAVGLGWIVSSLQVYLRDTAQVLSVALTLWFWITPIFASASRFPARLRFLLTVNPLAPAVNAYREILLAGRWPQASELGLAAAWSVSVFVIGGLFFRHMKRGFADVL